MRIKILHIVDSLNVGGLENGLINLINRSDCTKFEHVICCLREKGPMAQRISRSDVAIYALNNKARDYLMPFRLYKIISKIQPDIVHTRNWGTIDGILGARMAGIKHVIHGEHGRDLSDHAGKNLKRNVLRKILSFGVQRFVTVSEDLGAWLRGSVGISEQKITTIINGVDTERFCPGKDKIALKRDLGLPEDQILVGSVGRLDPIKNFSLLLKAVQGIKQIQCVIVGEGPERPALENMISDSQAIRLVGRKDDIASYLSAFDIFVLPSLNEGISNTVLEAMATGLPVIATEVGGNAELIENGRSGCLIPTEDSEKLRERIIHLIQAPEERHRLGSAARSRCEHFFSLDRMVRNYEDLYHDVVKML